MPAFVAPQLCTPVDRPPEAAGWGHEIKFDGYRVQVHLANETAKIDLLGKLVSENVDLKAIEANSQLLSVKEKGADFAWVGGTTYRPGVTALTTYSYR